jgi:hypothetical protein
MRYFHRTSVAIDDVLVEADRYFGAHLEAISTAARTRTFAGTIGTVTISARAEGGHYTLITVSTDQVGESELDKLSKRFLTLVHKRSEPGHVVRGAY